MSALNKVKDFFGFSEEDYETSPLFEEESKPSEKIEEANSTETKKPLIKVFKGSNSNTNQKFMPSEIKIEEPRIYEDSLNIATHLRDKKPVIINLKYLDAPTGKRLIDFICGTAYAINGHMLKIGENIFLFTPADVLIADSNESKNAFEETTHLKKEPFLS